MARKRSVEAFYLKRGRWWIAWTTEVPGALTQGRTLEEARENLRDAVRVLLEPLPKNALPARSPDYVRESLAV